MSALLFETLVWTGVLIAAVLLLRRPVTRVFGPQVAYALWALPAARLVLPPLTLPAWMAPEAAAPAAAVAASEPLTAAPLDAAAWQAAGDAPAPVALNLSAPAADPVSAGFDLLAWLDALPLAEILLAVWLGGAAVTLWRRFGAYFALRDALLAESREMGRAPGALGGLIGTIRLVETPATTAPLAFGVLDPVIALPPGFMALHDRPARDLALAHELAHHRAGDLLVNILIQPLFALHWFNPLGRYGWLALRRDQEAACDARVMARRSVHERVAYAALIARFAAAPGGTHHAALTAPMACPVLGETSIIHRLRSLAMSDLSPRRRLAGRALLGAGLLALPLTASISYAASDSVPEAPAVPAPPAPPAPTAPPAAPALTVPPAAPDAPQPPEGPAAPQPPAPPADAEDTEVTEHVWRKADGTEKRVRIVFRSPDAQMRVGRLLESAPMMDDAEREAFLAKFEADFAAAKRAHGEAMASSQAANASLPRVIVKQECKPGSEEVSETTTKDGVQVVSICQKRIFASARKGLEEARAEIAADRDIPEETRKQVLRTLDQQIARWSDKEG